jgi:type III secretion protein C
MAPTLTSATFASRCKQRLAAIAAITLCCFSANIAAAEIAWPANARFKYVAQKKDLRELLREFAGSQGITVAVADGVDGAVSGRFDLKPQAMLELLAASHGFLWFYDGAVLHITPSSDVRTQVIDLRISTPEQLQNALERLHLLDKRYPLQVDDDGATVMVSGPGSYVSLVQQVAANLEGKLSRSQATEVRVFPLHFAWAADHEFSTGGQNVTIPGVASVLSSMYQTPASGVKRGAVPSPLKINPMKSAGDSTQEQSKSGDKAAAVAKSNDAARGADPLENLPVIQADSRINAVLIRDAAARMKQYETLITKLDVRPAMIEIEARIIEISSEEAATLGVDWRLNSTPTANAGNSISRLNDVRNFVAEGGIAKSVLANAGLNLLERISALASQGKATVTASPAVLTLNNLEAQMDNQESFYVRVAGYQSSELFNITAGVTLRVTPMIVGEGDKTRIKLDVRIEDGRINDRTVDQIPTVKRSQINTQGFVNDGEALLIAGYSVDQDARTETRVPGLSKIPVLGNLFRNTDSSKSRMQRLFLLTPRIVKDPADDAAKGVDASQSGRKPGISGITPPPDIAPLLPAPDRTAAAKANAPADAPAAPKMTPAAPQEAPAGAMETAPKTDDKASSVNAAKPPAPEPAPTWEIKPTDHTLRNALNRWATEAGWQLSWELSVDFPLEAGISIPGTFEHAIETVSASMDEAALPAKMILYTGNKVLRVVPKDRK